VTRDVVDGTDADTVRAAVESRDPLPGTAGFAGALGTTVGETGGVGSGADSHRVVTGRGGRVVRDVLGRYPLFVDGDRWSVDPGRLDDPQLVPAGVCHDLETGRLEHLWTLPAPAPETDHARAIQTVSATVHGAIQSVDDDVAVAFSGGVDSALVASGVDAPCYVAGFPGSHDVEAAQAAARVMDRDLTVVDIEHADLVRAVPRLVRATGRTNPMDIGIALPLFLVAERARADGFSKLAVGQGADELFGGYAKVVDPAEDRRVDADTVCGARRETVETLPQQLPRDVLALRAAGVEPVAPFLQDRVVEAALSLPEELIATRDERKIALRRVAREVLPPEVADADKKAVQYGSLVARELDRLARQAGFKRRMDDHVGQYIRSLVDDADGRA
jgi:asparagine synthase (glutamine-hydrolysing)